MKQFAIAIGALVVAIVAAFGVGYVMNAPPAVAPVSLNDPAVKARPWFVKIHAKWCPVCMTTKGVWSELQEVYRDKANFVVLDFTNDAATAASAAEARRLGLDSMYEQYAGATGTIVVLDAARKLPREAINGSRNLADYYAAYDAVIRAAAPAAPINPRPAPESDTYIVPPP